MKKIFTCISLAAATFMATTPVMAQQQKQLTDKEKAALWKLRKEMSNSSILEVTDNVLEALKRTKTNEEFINNIK